MMPIPEIAMVGCLGKNTSNSTFPISGRLADSYKYAAYDGLGYWERWQTAQRLRGS